MPLVTTKATVAARPASAPAQAQPRPVPAVGVVVGAGRAAGLPTGLVVLMVVTAVLLSCERLDAGQAASNSATMPPTKWGGPSSAPPVGMKQMATYEPGSRSSIAAASRSEEHTSELQSLMRISYAV